MNPLGVRREKLAELIGSETIACEMIEAGWLKPIVESHKLTLFAVSDVAKAFPRPEKDGRRPAVRRATAAGSCAGRAGGGKAERERHSVTALDRAS
jgi:hypothetical protein